MFKTYILQKKISRCSIQVTDGNFITFSSVGFGSNYSTGFPRFSTTKKDIQEAIEGSDMFKDGKIKLESSVKETPDEAQGNPRVILGDNMKLSKPQAAGIVPAAPATPPADTATIPGQPAVVVEGETVTPAQVITPAADPITPPVADVTIPGQPAVVVEGETVTPAQVITPAADPITPPVADVTIPGQPAVVVEGETVTPAQVIGPIPPKTDVYPEVTTSQAAKEILRANYGVMAKDLKNREMILAAASEQWVSFPNLNVEP